VEVNAEGSIVRVLEVVPPRRGQTLRLHLDAALQVEAYYALEGKKGSVVAVEPGSGRIKALVSYPAYDPNLFVAGISGDMFARLRSSGKASLFNRAIAGQYPPGSTIKPFLALAGMHYEAAPETGLWCPGWFSLPGRPPRGRQQSAPAGSEPCRRASRHNRLPARWSRDWFAGCDVSCGQFSTQGLKMKPSQSASGVTEC